MIENTLSYLAEIAPVVAILGFLLHVVWKEYKEQRDLRFSSDRENLELLTQVSSALEKVVIDSKSNKSAIIQKLSDKIENSATQNKDEVLNELKKLLEEK